MTVPVDFPALAALRPGEAKDVLARALGSRWREPAPHQEGAVKSIAQRARLSGADRHLGPYRRDLFSRAISDRTSRSPACASACRCEDALAKRPELKEDFRLPVYETVYLLRGHFEPLQAAGRVPLGQSLPDRLSQPASRLSGEAADDLSSARRRSGRAVRRSEFQACGAVVAGGDTMRSIWRHIQGSCRVRAQAAGRPGEGRLRAYSRGIRLSGPLSAHRGRSGAGGDHHLRRRQRDLPLLLPLLERRDKGFRRGERRGHRTMPATCAASSASR